MIRKLNESQKIERLKDRNFKERTFKKVRKLQEIKLIERKKERNKQTNKQSK